MEQENKQMNSLPDNAYRELAPGEEYKPMMPANTNPKEVTPYSVTFGIIMAVIFSAAAAYLGLKVGQVFEAAIPIAIIAVGVGNMLGKKNMLGQNVIIQSIGASSGVIVAGAIFTLPALYILGLEAQFYQIFLSSLFGGFLGILLLIPFRKYFVKDMHGKYPFPEATATTEVLVSGEKKGNQAKLLAVSGLIGGLYDFCVNTFGWWAEGISTRIMGWGEVLADKMKVVFKVNTGAAVLGLGYIIGLKYAAIICAGSFTVWFVLIPFITYRYVTLPQVEDPAKPLFCIYTAPPGLCLTGYLHAFPEPSPVIAGFLTVLCLFMYTMVCSRLPGFLRLPFYPSYASFTFPFVISATGITLMGEYLHKIGFPVFVLDLIGRVQTAAAVVLISYVLLRFILYTADYHGTHTSAAARRRAA